METGSILGKYHILTQLGRGGMGVVYLAEDTTLRRQIALKVLDQSITSTPHFESRFLQEARLVASLNHPNIVPIHALEQINGEWILEMPYIEGGSLMDAEARGTLDLRQMLKCVRDVLLALAVCHEAGIVHRDVKPSNILLDNQGRGMLSDFGLAKLVAFRQRDSLDSNCSASLFIGTPRYAPPESWEEQEPTPAWDIYSMGMVLYEAVAGNTPYDAQTPLSLMKQMLERPIPPLKEAAPHISDELNGLVTHLLAREPGDRPQYADEVLQRFWLLPELSGDSTSPPVLVKPAGHAPAGRRTVRKTRPSPAFKGRMLLTAIAAVLVVMLLAGAGFLFLRRHTAPSPVAYRAPETISQTEAAVVSDRILFDTLDMETHEVVSGNCLSLRGGEGSAWRIVATGPAHLWFLELHPQPGELVDLQGHYAEYDRSSAMVFRHGTITGRGRWIRLNEELAVTFSLVSADTIVKDNKSILFKRAAPSLSETSFSCTLASSEAVPSLVYNELLPRNLSWVSPLYLFFHDVGFSRLMVPFHNTHDNPHTLDGRLEESVWRVSLEGYEDTSILMKPVSGPMGTSLRAWHDSEALYIGVHLATALEEPRLFLALQTSHPIPASRAGRWIVQSDKGEVVSTKHIRAGIAIPWVCDWKIAHYLSHDALEMEIKIPFAGLEMTEAPPAETCWLLNCQIGRPLPDGMQTAAQWGDNTVENTLCGLALLFRQ